MRSQLQLRNDKYNYNAVHTFGTPCTTSKILLKPWYNYFQGSHTSLLFCHWHKWQNSYGVWCQCFYNNDLNSGLVYIKCICYTHERTFIMNVWNVINSFLYVCWNLLVPPHCCTVTLSSAHATPLLHCHSQFSSWRSNLGASK